MRIVLDSNITGFGEAALLAFKEAGTQGMSHHISALFEPVLDAARSEVDGWPAVHKAIQRQYAKNFGWLKEELWYVAVPRLGYKRQPISYLEMKVEKYLVASVILNPGKYGRPAAVIGILGKAEKIILPLSFLLAIIEDDLSRFRIIGKEGLWTTWEAPVKGFQIRLHDSFLEKLSQILETKPVDRWLSDFGDQTRGITPLVVSDLLSLLNEREGGHLLKRIRFDLKELTAGLKSLGYSTAEAEEMVRQTPDLRADDSTEEALAKVLRHQSKGG